jgi:hypothetical protein
MALDPVVNRNGWSWKSTLLTVSLVSCVGCFDRQAPTDPSAIATPPAQLPEVADQITALSEAEGKTLLTLPPRPDLRPGDILQVREGERLIATALVTTSNPTQTQATVVALSDRRRPVSLADRFRPTPSDPPPFPDVPPAPAPVDEAQIAREQAATRLALAAALAPPTPEPAVVVAKPSAEEREVRVLAAPAAAVTPVPLTVTSTPAPAPSESAPVAPAAPAVEAEKSPVASTASAPDPEIHARLEAERAYYELAARVLRLPAAGAELTALQARLRQELSRLEQQP